MIKDTKGWFDKAIPDPTKKNLLVQLGVHLEEVAEMFEALDVVYSNNPFGFDTWKMLGEAIDTLATDIKKGKCHISAIDVDATFDSLIDQKVTGTGIAHMLGCDYTGGVGEVDRANWSKFDDEGNPIFDENGKITKGPNYVAPNLEPFLPTIERVMLVVE